MNPPSRLTTTLASLLCLPFLSTSAFADGADNFNDNSPDAAKWGSDEVSGNGVLTETSQRLQYTCPSGTFEDQSERPWELTRFSFNADWDMQIDTFNGTNPSVFGQVNSMGITILSPLSGGDYLYLELYRNSFGGSFGTGVNVDLVDDDNSVGGDDSGDLPINLAALRLQWNSATKVLSCYYDTDPADGYQWIMLASFGLAGSGGNTADADWGLATGDQFFASVFGYSAGMTVAAGEMYLDNFTETGGVEPGGGSRPKPTGRFPFSFPTGNALLTRILSLTGNYRGVTPAAQRNYNIDIAQDESGKLVAMGTMDGVKDADGDRRITESIGQITTVNGKPTAELTGSFNGTRDGDVVKVNATATVPVEVVDIGGGIQGVAGIASYDGKLAGVPISGDNLPVEMEAPPGAVDNLKADWSFKLVLTPKMVDGIERILASATLVLPNGDTIRFPERTVRYSQKRGYKINFRNGTNVSVTPHATDTNSAVLLRHLKFERQDGEWTPKAGKIVYELLGQRGTADLLEFVTP